jgi:putative transposase
MSIFQSKTGDWKMDTIELRKQAILMYLQDTDISDICRALKCSRPWLYKWIKRYQSNPREEWYSEYSRRPHAIHPGVDSERENLIVKIRRNLEKTAYAQIGAVSIQWELQKLQVEPPPIWTINRIIKKHGLVLKEKKPGKRLNEYPSYGVDAIHQMDLVGPRYIKKQRVYFCNIITADSHCVQVNQIPSKASHDILPAIIRFWQQFGIPDYLQMDNELSFRGSNRHPHSFGQLIRFVPSQGVTPIFIPVREPWRNGIIEKFNNTFDKKFFRIQTFTNLETLVQQSAEFEQFHNSNYRYSANQNQIPIQVHRLNPPLRYLDKDYQLPDDIPLEVGKIILIRFIRSDLRLNIFGEVFQVISELVYCSVEAIISIEGQSLSVYANNRLVQRFPYYVPVDWV